jgi:hypothetical protein
LTELPPEDWGEEIVEVRCHRCQALTPMRALAHEMWQQANAIAEAKGWERHKLDESVLCDSCYDSWQGYMRKRDARHAAEARADMDAFLELAEAEGRSVAWAQYADRLDDDHWRERAIARLDARRSSKKGGGF